MLVMCTLLGPSATCSYYDFVYMSNYYICIYGTHYGPQGIVVKHLNTSHLNVLSAYLSHGGTSRTYPESSYPNILSVLSIPRSSIYPRDIKDLSILEYLNASQPKKCMFAAQQVEFPEYTMTAEGVRPNQKNVETVVDFPRPKSAKGVRRFLGMATFYHQYIQRNRSNVPPFKRADKEREGDWESSPFVQTEVCQEAFEEVKRSLVSGPLLQLPDWEKEFFVWSDASLLRLGTVLEQEITEGKQGPIAYTSRTTYNRI